jgi:hypothetical protein
VASWLSQAELSAGVGVGGDSPSAALVAEDCTYIGDLRPTQLSVLSYASNSTAHSYFQHISSRSGAILVRPSQRMRDAQELEKEFANLDGRSRGKLEKWNSNWWEPV